MSKEEVRSALNTALEVGYRHIDTAYLYQNEDEIGKVLNDWIESGRIKRKDLFISTKVMYTQWTIDWMVQKSFK